MSIQVAPLALAGLLLALPTPEETIVLEGADGTMRRQPLAGFQIDSWEEADAVLVRFEGHAPAFDERAESELADLYLRNGDHIRGLLLQGRGDLLLVELLGGVRMTVSIDHLDHLVVPGRTAGAIEEIPVEGRNGDTLLQAAGEGYDRLDGAVEEFAEEGVRFDGPLGMRTHTWGELVGLWLEPFGELPPELADGPGVVAVDLFDGSRLRGRIQRMSEDACVLETPSGEELELALKTVSEIAVADGRLAFLSELPVAEAQEGSPFGDDLGMRWPHRLDRSVTGGPLISGGRQYTRGLGVHAPSRLRWELDGTWSRLRGACALSDEVLRLPVRGSVIFRVLVDGESRWESARMRGGDAPVELPSISLAGASELVLEVDMAGDFFAGDRANWLRMLLLR